MANFPLATVSFPSVIPSYLYVQYNDDSDLQAFTATYNAMAQQYVDFLNQVNLPIYTGLSGALLDWVAAGLYGMIRPSINGSFITDDCFKRMLTWNFYKGDGFQFSFPWLKRRVARFVWGPNGTDLVNPVNYYEQVGLTFINIFGAKQIQVNLFNSPIPIPVGANDFLVQALGVDNPIIVNTPFQFTRFQVITS